MKRLPGFWALFVLALPILLMLIFGQTMAVIYYELAVTLGLQEPVDVVGKTLVAVNRGFGLGDTLIYLPLMLFALIGLWFRKKWGIIVMAAAFGITAYWPLVCLFILYYAKGTPGNSVTAYSLYTLILTAISAYGLWRLWYIHKYRNNLWAE